MLPHIRWHKLHISLLSLVLWDWQSVSREREDEERAVLGDHLDAVALGDEPERTRGLLDDQPLNTGETWITRGSDEQVDAREICFDQFGLHRLGGQAGGEGWKGRWEVFWQGREGEEFGEVDGVEVV